jgi:hypothetical protein
LGTVAIVFSGTRGAMVGFVAGGVMLALLFRPKLTARHLGLTAVILIAGAVFYAAPTGEKLRARTRWSAEDPRGGARLTLWRDAAQMGAMHWASGWGPETFVTEFPHYQSRELARQFPDFYHESPHNIFLEAWTAQGIFGLLIMAGFCACALRTVGGSPVQRCLFGGFVALAVSLQFVSFTAPSAFGLYLMLGLLVALDPVDRQSAAYSLPRSVALPASCVALVYAVQLTATDTLLESSRQVLQAGFVAKAEADYGRAKAFQWVGPTSDLWFARALLESTANLPNPMARATTLEIARQAGEHATLRSEDRQNAFYTLAQISSLRNDLPGVEKNLRFAIASAPMWFKPHWMLAETLSLAGRQAEARAQAEVALDLDAGKDPEVRETWLRINGGPAAK